MADFGKMDAAMPQGNMFNCAHTGPNTKACDDKDGTMHIEIFKSEDSASITRYDNLNGAIFTFRDSNGDGKIDQKCLIDKNGSHCEEAGP